LKIQAVGTVASRQGQSEYFTGTVWADLIVNAAAPARLQAARVSFEPNARTAWHTHPLGQTLHVISGVGCVQLWGESARLIKAGDSVWIAPGEKHWHGATANTGMVHIAMHEMLDGNYADWMEHVTHEQYAQAVSAQ
jgi:quercetin dioxygenase-like cupin family protein